MISLQSPLMVSELYNKFNYWSIPCEVPNEHLLYQQTNETALGYRLEAGSVAILSYAF